MAGLLVPDSETLDDFGRSTAEVLEAQQTASRRLRSAISRHWVCPESLAQFPTDALGAELAATVARHGTALAAFHLSAKDGSRSKQVKADYAEAEQWLERARGGVEDLQPLVRRQSQGGGLCVSGGGQAPVQPGPANLRPASL